MPVNDCGICELINCSRVAGLNESDFKITLIKLLCEIADNTAGGGGGSAVATIEYFICDNGTQKIVQICYDGCSVISVTFLTLDRVASTAPADWGDVVAGVCGAGAAIAGSATTTYVSATAGGSVTAGAYSATIRNVGDANGTVGGVALFPGEEVSYQAFVDPVTNIFKKLPALGYDATGTTFHVSSVS